MSGTEEGANHKLNFTDVPLLLNPDDYFDWVDDVTASLVISRAHMDLEDALSVLGLQMRMRHWAELNDRLYFTLYGEETRRIRLAYPGEGWELSRFSGDSDAVSLVPTVLVTRLSPICDHHEYRHPCGQSIREMDREAERPLFAPIPMRTLDQLDPAVPDAGAAFFGDLDFANFPLVEALKEILIAFARADDDAWFAAHLDETERERFVCPGELCLTHGEGLDEHVEVRRIEGLLTRVLLHDEELPREMVGGGGMTNLSPERFAPSRLYPSRDS